MGRARTEAIEGLLANHTLIVGQSRSGKSTVARRLIEEVVLRTTGRVVVLDPNADFVEMNEVDPCVQERVLHPGTEAREPMRRFVREWNAAMRQYSVVSAKKGATWGLSWKGLKPEEKEAILGLSPVENFVEYRAFRRHLAYEESHNCESATLNEFRDSKYFEFAAGEDLDRYRAWLEFVTERTYWVDAAVAEKVSDTLKRLVVVDLAVDKQRKVTEQVRYMTAARALEALWEDGEKKRENARNGIAAAPWVGTMIVIDEAHLFAPPTTMDPQRRFLAETIMRLSDQGKKLNLFLVLVTQQPGKLNARILSECNNRIVLRMNEQLSLRDLEEVYGGARGRYDGAVTFKPGEGWGLIEGALLADTKPPDPEPRAVKFDMGRTKEGGGSPSTDWTRGRRSRDRLASASRP
jgi:DNA helicase HerA-like ATPase